MKKTNLLKGALSVLAVSVLLASCTQVDSRIDTIDTLETPSVKAVAYPGVNYISWDAVKGAQGYKVTKIVDGGIEEVIESDCNTNFITNVVPTDKVDVEYKVYALSNTDPSRAVYIYDSKAGSATVTNIFPPVGTEAIELPKYEKDSGWDFDKDADNSEWKDEFIPTAENIDIQYVDGTIVITAPTKAYLKTTVIRYTGNKEEIFYSDYSNSNKTEILPNYQNKKISNKTIITSAGDYKFKAEVRALAERKENAFYKASNITLTKTVKVPGLLTSKPTSNPEVAYIDDEQTTARVVFTPAVSKDGTTTYPVENYKVYRALKDSKQLDEVTGLRADSRTKNDKKEVIYVVEDKVPSNTVDYDYYVVLNVDGSLENGEKKNPLNKVTPSAANNGSIIGLTFTEFDDDKLANDIVAKVTPNSGSKIVSVSYAFSTSNDSSKVLDSAYTALVVVPELAETEQAFLIQNVPENNYVFVRAEFAEIKSTGKVNSVVVKATSDKYTVGKANDVKINIVEPSQKKGDTDCLLNDWIGNEIDVNGGELVSVKYGKAKNADLAKVAAINGTEVKFAVKDYDEGSNTYDYVFDIPDAGEVGEYIAIAAEVKAEGKKNNLIVQDSTSKVSVSGALPLDIFVPNPSAILDPKTSKFDVVLKVDISKAVYDANNSADNYDSVEISYIKTNAKYEITNETEWSEVTKYTLKDFSKDEIKEDGKTVGNNYSKTHIITNKQYSNTASTEVTEYYVIKVVPKYKVPGAKVDEKTYQRAFTYYK